MARGWGNDNAGEKLLAVSPGFGSLTWLVVFRRRTFTAQLGTRRLTAQQNSTRQITRAAATGPVASSVSLRFSLFRLFASHSHPFDISLSTTNLTSLYLRLISYFLSYFSLLRCSQISNSDFISFIYSVFRLFFSC